MSVTSIPAEDPPSSEQTHAVARATAVVALGNISSRVLGLAREVILSNLFGASAAVDAFKVAIIVPRGLYDLLIGGHVNSALVPVLSDYADNKDGQLWQLLSALLNLIVIIMATLVIIIELSATQIILLVADDETAPAVIDEAIRLLRITSPALFFLSLFAVMSSLLYAMRRFTLPAFAASAFNLTIVIVTAAFASQIGITAAAVGWLLGAVVQMALQWIGLRGTGGHWRLIFWHPAIKTVVLLYIPVMFSLTIDVLINRLFSYNLALSTGEGSISYMDWATTLMQFPQGLVATAISIVVLPTLSRQVAQLENFKSTLGLGLRLTLALIIPAAVGLMVLATPIVALIFEHGEFTVYDTAHTSLALRLYLIGLPFAAIDLLLVFAFYARQDTVTPAVIGLLSLVAYMVTALYLLPYYSFFALMIADSVKHLIHASVSAWLLMRRIGWLRGQQIIQTAMQAVLASAIMGVIAALLLVVLRSTFSDHTLLNELIIVVGAGGISGILYFAIVNWLGLAEIRLFVETIRQRFQ